MPKELAKRPIVMVSSTVYGVEELLDQIYAALTEFGYEVWSSHSGTMPTFSNVSAFDNCIAAVKACDLFLGIITPKYGSGRDGDGISITHQELLTAIEENKPRWLLAHDHVVFARKLLARMGYDTAEKRAQSPFKPGGSVMDDLRVIDMYEAATREDIQLKDRTGNWVQKFVNGEDALRYATAQFYRYQEVRRFLDEHLADVDRVRARVQEDLQR